MKPFLNISQQIELLESRGLIINHKDETANYLLSNNYYNIINGYGKYFTQSNDDYNNGTSFDEISRLYLFDKEIKQILLEAILTAESQRRSLIVQK